MAFKRKLDKHGFTLVELSIVLVIIGLLIGGILAAQSMISTARINATAQQLGQFDAMVMGFKTKYNYLPGDAPGFGGDGDGVVDMMIAGDNAAIVFMCEIANFWSNADQAQFPGTSACAQPGAKVEISGSAKNVPAAKMGKTGSFFLASVITPDGGYSTAGD